VETLDDMKYQAKTSSALAHRQLMANEGKRIGWETDLLSKDLDILLAEAEMYKDFVKKRTEIWKTASHQLREKLSERNELASILSGERSQQSIASDTQLTGEHHLSAASNLENDDGANNPQEGDAVQDVAAVKPKKEAMKRPSFSDLQLSEATMAVLNGELLKNGSKMAKAPAPLQECDFRSASFAELKDFSPLDQPKDPGPSQRDKSEIRKLCLKSREKRNQAGEAMAAVKQNPPERCDNRKLAESVGRNSGESSKGSGKSLGGSYLDETPGSAGYNVLMGPVVRGLGFSDCTADTTSNYSKTDISLASAVVNGKEKALPKAKPQMPKRPELKTTAWDE